MSPDFDQHRRRDPRDLWYLVRHRHHAQCQRHTCLRTWTGTVNGTRTMSGVVSVTDSTISHTATTVSGTGTSTVTGARMISGTSSVTDRKLS